jgi:hypothetical protein
MANTVGLIGGPGYMLFGNVGTGPVTITATPRAGSVFAGWSGGGCSGTATTCTVPATAQTTTTLQAQFDPAP